jgi:hypothetical protein
MESEFPSSTRDSVANRPEFVLCQNPGKSILARRHTLMDSGALER